ncbi:6-phosphogluconate dehydrogenase [Hyaloraphidium curvatum]|nr:6-phosphogluconate dehydrogenase [Hyaloraphidium curvatum]
MAERTPIIPLSPEDASKRTKETVLVFGAGNFGTCLADHLAHVGNSVTVFDKDLSVIEGIQKTGRNTKFFPDFQLDEKLKATAELTPELIASSTVILYTIPTQQMRRVLSGLPTLGLTPKKLLIFANKGIESSTGKLPNQIIGEVLGPEYESTAVFLSGPSFAEEVMSRLPTAVSCASRDEERAKWCQALFHAPFFRVYTTPDIIGVLIGGALKNVIAVAAGVASGQGLRNNTRAAIITRGLAEISRIGLRLGAQPLTFVGLSGVGDLLLTASSTASRNFTVGFRMGKGEKLDDILNSLGSTAEGIATTEAAFKLVNELQVDAPIIRAMHAVLFEGLPVSEGAKALATREMKSELYGWDTSKL